MNDSLTSASDRLKDRKDPEMLGNYRVLGCLGEGAMGRVYKVVHEPTGRFAAVKVIWTDAAKNEIVAQRFRREAKILRGFRHPNIVRFYAEDTDDGKVFMAMELIEGKTLSQLLRQKGRLSWPETAAIGVQLCSALQYAHDRKIVHRDLKPSNLMVTADNQLKLADFGIAKDIDGSILTADGKTVGTAHYMAPEQIQSSQLVTPKTDLYALGVLLYQLLTGKVPFSSVTYVQLLHMHLFNDPPRLRSTVDVPEELDQLIYTLMAKDPKTRPVSAFEVGRLLAKMLGQDDWEIPHGAVASNSGDSSLLAADPLSDIENIPTEEVQGIKPHPAPSIRSSAIKLNPVDAPPARPVPPAPLQTAPVSQHLPSSTKKGCAGAASVMIAGLPILFWSVWRIWTS